MQGAGNSYIFITSNSPHMDSNTVQHLCHPHYGIGGDGVVLLHPCNTADVAMTMYNKDGSRGAICGNALRCVAKLLYHRYSSDSYTIQCDSGIVTVDSIDSTHYTVHMPTLSILHNIDCLQDSPISTLHTVHCGNRHAVAVANITQHQLCQCMPLLDSCYLHGDYNVEVATVIDSNNANVVVYERGSGITLSCGSGAVATTAILQQLQLVEDMCHIHMAGGPLTVHRTDSGYTLTGDAIAVFSGDIL